MFNDFHKNLNLVGTPRQVPLRRNRIIIKPIIIDGNWLGIAEHNMWWGNDESKTGLSGIRCDGLWTKTPNIIFQYHKQGRSANSKQVTSDPIER
jgi:hypothetical protein